MQAKPDDGPEYGPGVPALLETPRHHRHSLAVLQGGEPYLSQQRHDSAEWSRRLLMDGSTLSRQQQPQQLDAVPFAAAASIKPDDEQVQAASGSPTSQHQLQVEPTASMGFTSQQKPGLVQASWQSMQQPVQAGPQMSLASLTVDDGRHETRSNEAGSAESAASRSRQLLQEDPDSSQEQLPSVREAAAEAEEQLEHPCLHQGFSRPYALRHKDPALPPLITLVGR